MNILRILFKDLKILESYDISVLTQSIKPKHTLSFKLHEGKRETDCLANITLAKGSNSAQSVFSCRFC